MDYRSGEDRRDGLFGRRAFGEPAGHAFDGGNADTTDAIDRARSRPDFLILCYPVISMTEPYMHRGSRENLLGKNADESLGVNLSTAAITAQPPSRSTFQPTPQVVPADACRSTSRFLLAGVPAELHIYQDGKHGVGLARICRPLRSAIPLLPLDPRSRITFTDRHLNRRSPIPLESLTPSPNKTSRPGASVHRRRLVTRESLHAINRVTSRSAFHARSALALNTAQSTADYPAGNRAARGACSTDRPSARPAGPG